MRHQRRWRSVEGRTVGVDTSGGGGGQGNCASVEKVEAPARTAVKEVLAPASLEEVVALALLKEAEAPLVEERPTLPKEVKVPVTLFGSRSWRGGCNVGAGCGNGAAGRGRGAGAGGKDRGAAGG